MTTERLKLRYRIESSLPPRAGLECYSATDLLLERDSVIVLARPPIESELADVLAIVRGSRAARSLHSPLVNDVYEADIDNDGTAYIVLAKEIGWTVGTAIRDPRLLYSVLDACRFTIDMIRACEMLLQLGIAPIEIAPDMVVVATRGTPKRYEVTILGPFQECAESEKRQTRERLLQECVRLFSLIVTRPEAGILRTSSVDALNDRHPTRPVYTLLRVCASSPGRAQEEARAFSFKYSEDSYARLERARGQTIAAMLLSLLAWPALVFSTAFAQSSTAAMQNDLVRTTFGLALVFVWVWLAVATGLLVKQATSNAAAAWLLGILAAAPCLGVVSAAASLLWCRRAIRAWDYIRAPVAVERHTEPHGPHEDSAAQLRKRGDDFGAYLH